MGTTKTPGTFGAIQRAEIIAVLVKAMHQGRAVAIGQPEVAISPKSLFSNGEPSGDILAGFVGRARRLRQAQVDVSIQIRLHDLRGDFIREPKKFLAIFFLILTVNFLAFTIYLSGIV